MKKRVQGNTEIRKQLTKEMKKKGREATSQGHEGEDLRHKKEKK